jgi:hypothetical protein
LCLMGNQVRKRWGGSLRANFSQLYPKHELVCYSESRCNLGLITCLLLLGFKTRQKECSKAVCTHDHSKYLICSS